jgi:hypothetical protein
MPKLNFIRGALAFMEIVHVQLPDKGVYIAVLKVGRECLSNKTSLVDYLEAQSIWGPFYDTRLYRAAYDFEQFFEERRYALLFAIILSVLLFHSILVL